MTPLSALEPRDCPVCGAARASGIPFFERRIDEARIDEYSFASRKAPEYMCYTLVRCPRCDVVYAAEAPKSSDIGEAYHQAAYDSKEEGLDAARTYELALAPELASLADRRSALEIGTGTGAFLQRLRARGFAKVIGIEPSHAAVAAADPDIRPDIREGLFAAGDYEPATFSLIACFMTLEHVFDPAGLVAECHRLLAPGGVMVAVVHDWRAWNNRVLGRRAPIIDIEHLQLFSKAGVTELFARAGFSSVEVRGFKNRYRIEYWNRLMPFPALLKRGVHAALHTTGVGRRRLALNVGNLMVVARK